MHLYPPFLLTCTCNGYGLWFKQAWAPVKYGCVTSLHLHKPDFIQICVLQSQDTLRTILVAYHMLLVSGDLCLHLPTCKQYDTSHTPQGHTCNFISETYDHPSLSWTDHCRLVDAGQNRWTAGVCWPLLPGTWTRLCLVGILVWSCYMGCYQPVSCPHLNQNSTWITIQVIMVWCWPHFCPSIIPQLTVQYEACIIPYSA